VHVGEALPGSHQQGQMLERRGVLAALEAAQAEVVVAAFRG
jgi:hypothetical protein